MIRRYLVLANLAVLSFLLSPPEVYACSCVKLEVPQAFRKAQAVFIGEVIEIIQPRSNSRKAPLAAQLFEIKFKVEKTWKGISTEEIVILSDQGRAGCFSWGPFLKDRKYLVYADRRTSSRRLAVLFICNRTELVANAAEDLKILNMMKPMTRLKRFGSVQ